MSDDIPPGTENVQILHQVVSIVSAYVSHNSLRPADLADLIASVNSSIRNLADASGSIESKTTDNPAVPVKKSVNKDFIVCLEDGKKFKSLRRHLSSFHNLTPDEYRAKWGLGSDYPMVAPAYSETRSQLAKESGLGQVARPAPAKAKAEAEATPTKKKAGRGRPKKIA